MLQIFIYLLLCSHRHCWSACAQNAGNEGFAFTSILTLTSALGTCIPRFNYTHISFLILTYMSNNNKSLDKCPSGNKNCVAMEHNKSKFVYCTDMRLHSGY